MIARVHAAGQMMMTLCLLAGCANPAALPPRLPDAEPVYVIGVSDLLKITVWKHDDLAVEAPVRSDGKISVPLFGDVQAAGRTPEQLKEVIREKLSASLVNPVVTVVVVSPDSQMVTVIGGVLRSGRVSLTQNMGVLEAVAAAGGFSAWANKSDVRVIRSVDDERVSYRFDYRAYIKGAPDSDIRLKPGDVVVVPE